MDFKECRLKHLGDRVRIEMLDAAGASIFGANEQRGVEGGGE